MTRKRAAALNPGMVQIASDYRDEIAANRERLCRHCRYHDKLQSIRCDNPILPITSDGSDCPYYQEVPDETPVSGPA